MNFKRHLKKIVLLVFYFIANNHKLSGQAAVVSSGRTVASDSGSISYSVGQVNFKFIQSNSGTSSEGVQQAIVIEEVSNIDENLNKLQVNLFPNPTENDLFIVQDNLSNINYNLMDASSRILCNGQINTRFTKLELSEYPSGIYFLKLDHSNNKNSRTFKIIKK